MAIKTMVQAITDGLDNALSKNDKVIIFGEDVGVNGGVFRATVDLQAKHGVERVFDTPLAESAIGGLAIGLALEDYVPVMEIQFSGFFFEVMDSIMGQASRYSYRMNRTRTMPITIRAPFGGGVHTPEMHADSLEGLLAQTPGLRVIIPSNAYDAKGLLLASIECQDPVVFLEHMKLYRSNKEEVPEEYYTLPLDKANVVQAGNDLSIITYGAMVKEAREAIVELEKLGHSIELIDLRSIAPLDVETIINSVSKTGRVLIVQEAQQMAGVGANIASMISERVILSLKAPIKRLSAPNTVYAFGMVEKDWLPNKDDILRDALSVLSFEY